MLSKTEPVAVEYGFKEGGQEHNSEGRLITAEFDTFYLVTTYVPNAGRGLVTLDKRMDWDPRYTETNRIALLWLVKKTKCQI